MVNQEFSSIKELYNKVLPALKSKKNELKINKIYFIEEKDIFLCLQENKWRNESNLTLFDIVNDILNVKIDDLLTYMKNMHENR